MSQAKYPKAYEAYQQAVYRDGRNPTFWCSIGVLYYQINQYRDALDAYSRAIRLNPYISEVWYDLGTLVSHLPLLSARHPLTTPIVRIVQQPNHGRLGRLHPSCRARPVQPGDQGSPDAAPCRPEHRWQCSYAHRHPPTNFRRPGPPASCLWARRRCSFRRPWCAATPWT